MAQRDRYEVSVYARIADPDRLLGDVIEHDAGGVRVRLIVNNFTQRNPLCRSGFHCRRIAADFRALLDEVRPEVVHVHHLAGHCASLMTEARRRGVPIVYQVQDWWPLCARTNLVDRQGALCSGPAPAKCARCLPITGLPGAIIGNPLLYAARHHWMRRQLACAAAFVMGSRFIANSFQEAQFLPPGVPQHVLPYGVIDPSDDAAWDEAPSDETPSDKARRDEARWDQAARAKAPAGAASADRALPGAALDARASSDGGAGHAQAERTQTQHAAGAAGRADGTARRALRFGYIGALLPHKGVHVAIEAFAAIEAGAAELHIWGVGDDAGYRKRLEASAARVARVAFHGAFPESAKGEVLGSLDVLIVPSIGLESFGIAAREAMAYGVPVLASRLGALTELEAGELFEPGDATALARIIARVIAEPALLRRWRAALPRVKTMREHAEEIERVYDEVITRTRDRAGLR
jgi:glycosyltransferase involved in cell wall biosynthesis